MSRRDWLGQWYERRRQAQDMRAHGATFDAIGTRLGISRQRAWQLVSKPVKGMRT